MAALHRWRLRKWIECSCQSLISSWQSLCSLHFRLMHRIREGLPIIYFIGFARFLIYLFFYLGISVVWKGNKEIKSSNENQQISKGSYTSNYTLGKILLNQRKLKLIIHKMTKWVQWKHLLGRNTCASILCVCVCVCVCVSFCLSIFLASIM